MKAKQIAQPTPDPTPPAWWTLPLPRAQWMQRAHEEAARKNDTSTNQHVNRKQGDR